MSKFSYLVAVIILNYKNSDDTICCLESIMKIRYHPYKLFVIDNDSKDGSFENILCWANSNIVNSGKKLFYAKSNKLQDISKDPAKYAHNDFFLLENEKNGGYAHGNNLGIRLAEKIYDPNFFWIINNDIIVSPDKLMHIVDDYFFYNNQSDIKVGIIGSKINCHGRSEYIQSIGGVYNRFFGTGKNIGEGELDKGQYNHYSLFDTDYPIGASLFVSREFINDVGYMNEKYFLYYEELDWIARAKKRNYSFGYCYKGEILHKEGATIGSSSNYKNKSLIADYYGLRGRLLFSWYHDRLFFPFVLSSLMLVLFERLSSGQFLRVKDLFLLFIKGISKRETDIFG